MPTNMQAQITAGCGAGVGAGAVTPGNVINDWADSDSLLASASQQTTRANVSTVRRRCLSYSSFL